MGLEMTRARCFDCGLGELEPRTTDGLSISYRGIPMVLKGQTPVRVCTRCQTVSVLGKYSRSFNADVAKASNPH